ncbi:hypothetical protein GCM10025864_22480 [Luteimicrobium album]|uniref:Uncharacterized protein n=1 Tax=Luteimicrobium album TaxID=1054550 RepID=A0ABQ6I176_9MICO|nr:hypothetical protein GCM10025864_22480 [Luteimicrobium album]
MVGASSWTAEANRDALTLSPADRKTVPSGFCALSCSTVPAKFTVFVSMRPWKSLMATKSRVVVGSSAAFAAFAARTDPPPTASAAAVKPATTRRWVRRRRPAVVGAVLSVLTGASLSVTESHPGSGTQGHDVSGTGGVAISPDPYVGAVSRL